MTDNVLSGTSIEDKSRACETALEYMEEQDKKATWVQVCEYALWEALNYKTYDTMTIAIRITLRNMELHDRVDHLMYCTLAESIQPIR